MSLNGRKVCNREKSNIYDKKHPKQGASETQGRKYDTKRSHKRVYKSATSCGGAGELQLPLVPKSFEDVGEASFAQLGVLLESCVQPVF